MYRLLILSVLFVSMPLHAQENSGYETIDSLSYAYFLEANWDEVIKIGHAAIASEIDFKRLRQRMGYAYFAKSDYYNAIKHYEKSLAFDPSDEISHLYLYFSGINTGDESYARYHASKLPEKTRKEHGIKAFRPVDAVDAEYNKKLNDYQYRSDPDYYRFGLNSQLGYRLSLYQSVSRYSQYGEYNIGTINAFTANTVQDEYFALLNWSAGIKTNLSLGYHYVNAKVDYSVFSQMYPGNIFTFSLNRRLWRFNTGFTASVYSNDSSDVIQTGLYAGVALPGKVRPYLKSSVYNLNENGTNRIVFSQTAGFFAAPKLWLQAAVTLGNLNNFVNANGLYVYNSLDPTIFRTGFSAFLYQSRHFTLYTNYTFDKKQIYKDLNNYNQHSITGGIIWKL